MAQLHPAGELSLDETSATLTYRGINNWTHG